MRMDCWSLYKIYGFLYHISALPLILEGKGLLTVKQAGLNYTSLDDGKIRQAFSIEKEREV